jgi:hypothetical protein
MADYLILVLVLLPANLYTHTIGSSPSNQLKRREEVDEEPKGARRSVEVSLVLLTSQPDRQVSKLLRKDG